MKIRGLQAENKIRFCNFGFCTKQDAERMD